MKCIRNSRVLKKRRWIENSCYHQFVKKNPPKIGTILNVCRNKVFFELLLCEIAFFFQTNWDGRLNYYCRYGYYRRYESSVNKFRCLFSVLLNQVYVAISRAIYSAFSIWFLWHTCIMYEVVIKNVNVQSKN